MEDKHLFHDDIDKHEHDHEYLKDIFDTKTVSDIEKKLLAVRHFLRVHANSKYLKTANTSASSGMGIKK